MKVLSEIGHFVRMHWVHLLILPGMVFLVTFIHESAHSVAVLVQGGTVTQFCWLPSGGRWGFMSYEFAEGHRYSSFAISVAPYCLWFAVAAGAVCIGLTCRNLPFWLGSSLFVWWYVVPLGDIANTALPYLAGCQNDFRHAFGRPLPIMRIATAVAAGVSVVVGFPLQRRLYGERRLSLPAYFILAAVSLGAVAFLSGAA